MRTEIDLSVNALSLTVIKISAIKGGGGLYMNNKNKFKNNKK